MSRHAILAFAALALASGAQAQQGPPPAPRMDQNVPRGGTLVCELQSEDGQALSLKGEIGWSEPRREGQRFPEVKFEASDPSLSARYHAEWSSSGGRFLHVSRNGGKMATVALVTRMHLGGKGAVAMQVSDVLGRPQAYYSGFCSVEFSDNGRNFE
jgi:hypothetical protein